MEEPLIRPESEDEHIRMMTRDMAFRMRRPERICLCPRAALIIDHPELLAAFHQDAVEARDALLKRYSGVIYGFVRRWNIPPGLHEDVVQEGMVGLLNALYTYDPNMGASLLTHIYHCVRKSMMGVLRHGQATGATVSIDDDDGDPRARPMVERIPTEDGEFEGRIEEISALQAAMAHLDEDERRVIGLYYGFSGNGEKTLHEIAALANRSHEWVRIVRNRALRKLKTIIAEEQ